MTNDLNSPAVDELHQSSQPNPSQNQKEAPTISENFIVSKKPRFPAEYWTVFVLNFVKNPKVSEFWTVKVGKRFARILFLEVENFLKKNTCSGKKNISRRNRGPDIGISRYAEEQKKRAGGQGVPLQDHLPEEVGRGEQKDLEARQIPTHRGAHLHRHPALPLQQNRETGWWHFRAEWKGKLANWFCTNFWSEILSRHIFSQPTQQFRFQWFWRKKTSYKKFRDKFLIWFFIDYNMADCLWKTIWKLIISIQLDQ